MNKNCSRCRIDKPTVEFSRNASKKDGLQTFCKLCANNNSKNDYVINGKKDLVAKRASRDRTRAKIFTDNIRRKYGCLFCVEKTPCCIDFHHIRDKTKEISFLRKTKNKSALVEELQKCITVCANCHRKLHQNLLMILPQKTLTLEQLISCGLNEYLDNLEMKVL